MEEQFGGPVWHASGRGHNPIESKRFALAALTHVGDSRLGEWVQQGTEHGIVHVLRRLTPAEREAFAVPDPYDIRGTPEEERRMRVALREFTGALA